MKMMKAAMMPIGTNISVMSRVRNGFMRLASGCHEVTQAASGFDFYGHAFELFA